MPAGPLGTSVIEHEFRVAARPEVVFAYFTDPRRMIQWMGAQATLDPRPGGICRIVFEPSAARLGTAAAEVGAVAMTGQFVTVDPPRYISLTWGWEYEPLAIPPQSTALEVSFTEDGDETVVRLVHREVPPAAVDFHRAGWAHYLARLTITAAGIDPGIDPWQAQRAREDSNP
jgi:uncharacterized protein YndB with AHSA1/START domain